MKKINFKTMTDEQHRELLRKFIQQHPLCRDIEVAINPYGHGFSPKGDLEGFHIEDAQLLSEIIRGADHFIYWMRRENK
jgi:hypothetical protein